MKTNYEVGKTYYDSVHFPNRELILNRIEKDFACPLVMSDGITYTLEGRFFGGAIPTLSETPYTLNRFTAPRPAIKRGDLVYVRGNDDNEWYMRFFSHYENGKFYCFYNQEKEGATSHWDYCETTNPLTK